ncbi:hypothetical protein [Shewanella dokdonensis]|uniref:Rad50/SbcC-type AAA domain-containing protein n=1 Tax=Shewanella dokdonensis TaxID=712036 RepID=A0ABX8DD10_9GAMM|nr:hypothetical protein [Shewanella dokdonensis]MCL1074511.1 hypothetical protein [Shewanella dokdonensis]QVK22453.1 hypothetical protein KHX94_13950 [Shewanella dokdonensis]
MKIKKFAFGNEIEAFIETRLSERVNIIFSDDNNKGKTLVLQGMMFSLGNEPIFPAGFDYKDYYFYIEFIHDGNLFRILRKNNTFSIISENGLSIFESTSEFKYFFDENIYKLPEIVHRELPKLVDLSLFIQMFFVGQDKRDTSSIFNSGYYNKSDFIDMLFSLKGVYGGELSNEQITELKDRLKQLRISERKLVKEIDRFNINKAVLENVKKSASFKEFQEQEKFLKELHGRISEIRKKRYSEVSRLNNYINLELELNSLNRAISFGRVSCEDCGSENITYKSKDITFDISNLEVRKSILKSLKGTIDYKKEAISRIDYDLSSLQEKMSDNLGKVSPTLRDVILFRDELNGTGKLDKELQEKQREIELVTRQINESNVKKEGVSEKQRKLIDEIVKVMNKIYRVIDEDGLQTFHDLFTKRSVNYSGSEEQEFYFSRVYALLLVMKHEFPIVIDSFRDRELSSLKEMKMIDAFESLDNQVIISATLKKEEYTSDKYETHGAITAIDYSANANGRILSDSFKNDFVSICRDFGVRF